MLLLVLLVGARAPQFLELPLGGLEAWEPQLAAAGAFLAAAKDHLEDLGEGRASVQAPATPLRSHSSPARCMQAGYEVQTTRIATQPFRQFIHSCHQQQPADRHAALVEQVVGLEAAAARHGVGLVSIGSSDNPDDLDALPALIAATRSTSCTFAMPPQPDWALAQRVAGAIMRIAAVTGGVARLHMPA